MTNSSIYVANYFGGYVGLYTLDGVAVNANWITGFGAPWGIVVPMSAVTTGTSVELNSINVSQYPIFAGGTLLLNNGESSSQAFSVQSEGGTITSPGSGSATLSGVFSGAGGLSFNGTGTTILTGANTYSGGTTVSSGTLQGDTTSLQGSITNNSTVVFDQSSTGTYAGVMSGTGVLTKQGTGVLVLTGANTYSGGTTIASGTVSIAGASPTGTGDIVVNTAATLMGAGTISGNVLVSGRFKPGNSPGYIAISKNLTLDSGAVISRTSPGRHKPAALHLPVPQGISRT